MSVNVECYGKMFPSVLPAEHNRKVEGHVFNYRIVFPGLAATKREVGFDQEAWERCTTCQDFETCYRLSTAILLLEKSLATS